MITLNLLPDIKKQYLKAQRTKRVFIVGSFLVSAGFLALVVLMSLYVYGVQKVRINGTQDNIDEAVAALIAAPDFDRVVTIQNQLEVLPGLHDDKPVVNRMFNWLKTLVPNEIDLSSLNVNYEEYAFEIKGSGEDLKAVNVFVDTLKNAQYKYSGHEELAPAFSSVVLDSTGVDKERVTYKIQFIYDPLVFDGTVEGLVFSVPNITSSRSETERPKALYESSTEEGTE